MSRRTAFALAFSGATTSALHPQTVAAASRPTQHRASRELMELGRSFDEKFEAWCGLWRAATDLEPMRLADPEYRRLIRIADQTKEYDEWLAYAETQPYEKAWDVSNAMHDEIEQIVERIRQHPINSLADVAVKARTLVLLMKGADHAKAGPDIKRIDLDWDHLKLLEFVDQINAAASA